MSAVNSGVGGMKVDRRKIEFRRHSESLSGRAEGVVASRMAVALIPSEAVLGAASASVGDIAARVAEKASKVIRMLRRRSSRAGLRMLVFESDAHARRMCLSVTPDTSAYGYHDLLFPPVP